MNSDIDLYPLMLTRGIVLFPGCSTHMEVGRAFSILACKSGLESFQGKIVIACQKDIQEDFPILDNIFKIGMLCSIDSFKESTKQKGSYRVKLTGISRVALSNITFPIDFESDYFTCEVSPLAMASTSKLQENKAIKNIVDTLRYIDLTAFFPSSLYSRLESGITAEDLSNQLSSLLPILYVDKQKLLEEDNVVNRLTAINDFLKAQKNLDDVEESINKKVREKTDRSQREYILREKMRAIQDELNEISGDEDESDSEKILKKVEENPYPDNIKKRIKQELKRYEQMPSSSMEASMQKTYVDWLVNLPWYQKTEDNDDLTNVQQVLDEDHYGLEKVKQRIVEYLAVKKMTNSLKAPILCLYGPPGVGKTSLAKSIARALGRKFVKASLGGVQDEAEIRGHRRTYVGAMPGRIIKGIKNSSVINPVFLLDEIDKMASSNKGDPSSAMLEVLDPEQNTLFQDNYIEETYDLSNVLFIATANYLQNVPAPLRDRLELIELNSYTSTEKLHIAKEHLISKQATLNGLSQNQIKFEDKAIQFIIDFYTREAGVRELERLISAICRKVVVSILKDSSIKKVVINPKKVVEFLGIEKFDYSKKEKKNQVGVVTGLAYTEFGGDILPIEVTYFEGKGGLVITGNLGNVMKESASIALDYVKANAVKYHISPEFFEKHDIHIHCPEGAVPKDGPSAGVALTVAIISSITKQPVSSYVAMTGEVTLRGNALPIGGLKEKTLAALRSGIKIVCIPKENQRNVFDLPDEVKDNLKIVLMENVDHAIEQAFNC